MSSTTLFIDYQISSNLRHLCISMSSRTRKLIFCRIRVTNLKLGSVQTWSQSLWQLSSSCTKRTKWYPAFSSWRMVIVDLYYQHLNTLSISPSVLVLILESSTLLGACWTRRKEWRIWITGTLKKRLSEDSIMSWL